MAIFKAIEENTLPTEAARSRRAEPRHQTTVVGRLGVLARVDGFDQDKAESKRDERAVILAVFSHRSAIRLKRLSLPTACSMRARAL